MTPPPYSDLLEEIKERVRRYLIEIVIWRSVNQEVTTEEEDE